MPEPVDLARGCALGCALLIRAISWARVVPSGTLRITVPSGILTSGIGLLRKVVEIDHLGGCSALLCASLDRFVLPRRGGRLHTHCLLSFSQARAKVSHLFFYRDRKSVVWGKSGSVRLDLCGRRKIKK